MFCSYVCPHGVEVEMMADCPRCEGESIFWSEHYAVLTEPDVPLIHLDFQIGEIVLAGRFGEPREPRRILSIVGYNNPTGSGPANTALYEVDGIGVINGVLLNKVDN